MLNCQICYRQFNHLGSHIWHKHKIKANEYKTEFGLSLNHALITEEIKLKKQIAFNKDRENYLANLKGGEKYYFKKGEYKKTYFSRESLDKARKNLKKINSKKPMSCPFCKMLTKHLESHIYNKHGYLYVKR